MSVDVLPEQQRAWVRFVFDGVPGAAEEEEASVAYTEILADFPEDWKVEIEFVRTPAPEPMEHLRLLVFLRCEGDGSAPARG